MLTPKQEKFCQYIVEGLSQVDAYKKAFEIKTAKANSVYTMASRLLKNVKIESRLEELKKGVEKELAYSAIESFKRLKEIQSMALSNQLRPDLTNAIKAEELCGKLAGLYVEKKDITANIDTSPFTIEIVK